MANRMVHARIVMLFDASMGNTSSTAGIVALVDVVMDRGNFIARIAKVIKVIKVRMINAE